MELSELLTEFKGKDLLYRRGQKEIEATDLVLELLKPIGQESILIQSFENAVPIDKKVELFADGIKIEAKGSSFVSGKIDSKEHLMSSFIYSTDVFNLPNINFNPYSDVISSVAFYNASSVAISRKDIPKVLKAKNIEGTIEVEKFNYMSSNILVGNSTNPTNLIFCHIDTIHSGVIDNLSGLFICLDLALNHSEILEDNLIVFSGNEELSYDFPTYWGYGYRKFQKEYQSIFNKAENIIVVDCVGPSMPTVIKDDTSLNMLAFPISDLDQYNAKISIVQSSLEELMQFYHSDEDKLELLSFDAMHKAIDLVLEIINNK